MNDRNVCTVEGCAKPIDRPKQGLCEAHYTRLRRHGSVYGRATNRKYQKSECSVSGCSLKPYAQNFCSKHYTRLLRHGSPIGGSTGRGHAIGWLLDHVKYSGKECLKWPYASSSRGYGLVTYQGRQCIASRVMCSLAHGEPEDDSLQAAHSCGKGHEGCVNPNHLRWATITENHADKLCHGTHGRGESHSRSKLSNSIVIDIRKSEGSISARRLAADYGISVSMVYRIWRRQAWAHI